VTQTDDQRYSVIGDLVITGVTRPVSVDLTLTAVALDALGRHRVVLKGSADIDRSHWDVTWNRVLEGYGIFVGRRVTTVFNVTAVGASSG
jgi:polyisoprenoid-binding protein YceI